MPGTRRGLVAPQNTFLENIVRRCNGSRKKRENLPFFLIINSFNSSIVYEINQLLIMFSNVKFIRFIMSIIITKKNFN
jgi:hypothetical protein